MPKLLVVLSLQEIRELPLEQAGPPNTITGECQRCGRCCEYYECPLYELGNKECIIHGKRPVACRIWPRREDEIIETKCPGYKQTGL